MKQAQQASYFNIIASSAAAVAALDVCNRDVDSSKSLLAAGLLMLSCSLMVMDIYGHLCKRPLSAFEKRRSGVAGLFVALVAVGNLFYNIQGIQPEFPTPVQKQVLVTLEPRL